MDEKEQMRRGVLEIEPMALEEEFVQLPADLARANYLFAASVREVAKAKIACDRTRARIFLEVRATGAEDGGRVTEKFIEAMIDSNEDFIGTRLALAEAETDKAKRYGLVDALRAKRDALVNISASTRIEMGMNQRAVADHRAYREQREDGD